MKTERERSGGGKNGRENVDEEGGEGREEREREREGEGEGEGD